MFTSTWRVAWLCCTGSSLVAGRWPVVLVFFLAKCSMINDDGFCCVCCLSCLLGFKLLGLFVGFVAWVGLWLVQ